MMTENIQQSEHRVVGICYMVVGIIGVAGHGSLLMKYVQNPNVRSPSHLLHISLAVANLGVVAAFPFSGLSDLAGKWLFGPVGCQAYAFEGMTSGIASILTTTALAVERYLHAKRPNLVAGATTKNYTLVVIYIWFKSLFWASMPLLGWARYSLDVSGTSCALDWRTVDDKYVLYILAVSCLAYVLPCTVIVVCLMKARDTQNPMKKAVLPTNKLNEAQLINITIAQAFLSVIAWSPFAALCLQFLFRNPKVTSATASVVPPLFAKAVTAIMPLVYKLNTSVKKSNGPNGTDHAKDVQNDKAE